MAKRTKFQIKANARKRAISHFNGLTSGMTAILSAYLLAISVKFISLSGPAVYASYLATFSIVLLVIYKFLSFFESEGRLKDKNPLAIVASLGLTSGLLAYFFILGSINLYLAGLAIVTFCFGLLSFCWSFKVET
ncbi:hypothetical protein I6E72_14585 [Pseudoalteromonas sp. NSLLW24]|uniref:hypothetical protein n=1 Tax=Pseudoalteromonas sp. NSLLW24 TaxID=2792050 RepID=UPI0018CF642B|nr:hypothetical protein [Pseudoalteromonas sp. NSLLW24]MBH0000181.1 hypothetical protein [Pseudoalteromonas sp. NSLLW24]